MSVSVSRGDGVTVLTLTSDPQSFCPPLCQILGTLCWSPACCSLDHRRRERGRRGGALGVLGTLQILVGVFSIGLAVILCQSPASTWWRDDYTAYPFWMGGVFVTFGVFSILSEKFPSPCLLVCSSILQVSGIFFAIVAIVLYSINMGEIFIWKGCNGEYEYDYFDNERTTPSPAPYDALLREKCVEGKEMLEFLAQGINGILIVLCVLELCVVLSAAVIVIKTLRNFGKEEKQSAAEPLQYQPLVA